jgi:hypothetical protein
VKIKVLEIAWSYLYSGREPEAWLALADMWPDSDVQRLRTAMLDVRSHGIHAQVDGISSGVFAGRKKRVMVFDSTHGSGRSKSEIVPPQPILLRQPAPVASERGLTDSELLLDLLIDSAGKVRSVEPAGNTKSAGPDLLMAATGWKFVPAFKDGRAVASRLRLAVSARR